jgi:hypothetical protein
MEKMNVHGREISVANYAKSDDYISITDIAKHKDEQNPRFIIQNWMRNRNSIEFLGIWELLNNPNFNRVEFDTVRMQAGINSFVLTPQKWIDTTGAIGITAKAGRYGGTYAHKEIAFEFASWVSVEFKLYLVKEFDRLKQAELEKFGWDIKRNLTKVNYLIHTEAIKANLIPPELTKSQISQVYASEADVLNLALFGTTARHWRDENPKLHGSIRDHATVAQLVCLLNLENINSLFIADEIPQHERLLRLNKIAIDQMHILAGDNRIKALELYDLKMRNKKI